MLHKALLCMFVVVLCGCASSLTAAAREQILNITVPAAIQPTGLDSQTKQRTRNTGLPDEVKDCLAVAEPGLATYAYRIPSFNLETKEFGETALTLTPMSTKENPPYQYEEMELLQATRRTGRIFGHVQIVDPNLKTLEYLQDLTDQALELQKDEPNATPLVFTRQANSTTWESDLMALWFLKRPKDVVRITIQWVDKKHYAKTAKALGEQRDAMFPFGKYPVGNNEMFSGFAKFLDRTFAPKYQGTITFRPVAVETFDARKGHAPSPVCYPINLPGSTQH